MSEDAPTKRRRRTELACTTCRQKKHGCDGTRPQCSTCRLKHLECVYTPSSHTDRLSHDARLSRASIHMPWSSPGDFDARPTTSSPVVQRQTFGQDQNPSNNGEVLSLQDVSRVSSSAEASAHILRARPHEQTVHVDDDDGLVDVLATTTFNDSSDVDMGYFGLSSNHALFGSLSDVFIKASRLFGAEGTNIQGPPLSLPEQQGDNDAPPTHADMEKAGGQEHNAQNTNRSYNLPRYQDAVLLINHYFTTVGSSSGILASIVGFMYNHNVEVSKQRSLPELIEGYNGLFLRLEEWRETVSHFGGLVSITELSGLSGTYEALRLRILLSIHYHRLILMTSWPVIIAFANSLVEGVSETHSGLTLSWDEYTPVANADWFAVRELCAITHAITTAAEPFLHSNAAWYTCNYTSLTVCLHLFVLLLTSRLDKENQLGLSTEDIRDALESGLNNMKVLERTSLMTYKARKCLVQLLEAFDILAQQQIVPQLGAVSGDVDLSEFIRKSADEFLLQAGLDDFLNTDFGSYGDNAWL
ncbi:hypothetical protein PV11_07067 [Exophiala sideris]|uniref:Zn(2)-C6 fungal-type domain-containing protein n=1 Tax=Exophiala sideris TaxID=1016849 RepID=A0A0D1VTR0_9EURO|nr:hypothetical protein PV11_07067 [Exophiala sideris]